MIALNSTTEMLQIIYSLTTPSALYCQTLCTPWNSWGVFLDGPITHARLETHTLATE